MLERNNIYLGDSYELVKQIADKSIDLIVIDPPYQKNIAVNSIKIIMEKEILNEDGLIVLETDEEQREIEQLENLLADIEAKFAEGNSSESLVMEYNSKKHLLDQKMYE